MRKANFDFTQFEPFLAKANSFRKEKKNIPFVINWKIQRTHSDLSWEMARSKRTSEDTKTAPSCRLTRSLAQIFSLNN